MSTRPQTLARLRHAGVQFVIGGSYALRSKVPVHDLDVVVAKSSWEKLRKLVHGSESQAMTGRRLTVQCSDGEIEFFDSGHPSGFSYEDLHGYDRDEHGNPTWTVAQTLAWKRAMGRPKDMQHIQMWKQAAGPGLQLVQELRNAGSGVLQGRLEQRQTAAAVLSIQNRIRQGLESVQFRQAMPELWESRQQAAADKAYRAWMRQLHASGESEKALKAFTAYKTASMNPIISGFLKAASEADALAQLKR